MKNKETANQLLMKKSTPYYFIAPALTILALMVFYPLLYGFWLSLTNMSLKTFRHPQFIGFDNYVRVFTDPRLVKTLIRTIIWTVVNVFFHVTIGLWLAVLLNRKLPGKAFLRVFLIIPWAMPQYIAALTWRGMFNFKFGAVNIFLSKIGIPPLNWLSQPSLTFLAAIITNIWLGFPFMMMVALGGLQSISKNLYEAAEIDGATPWQQFKNITLPLLKPVMTPSIVLGTVWTFNMLNVIIIIANGFGNEETQILVTDVYRLAFQFYRYGYAAAYSVVIFLILLLFGVVFVAKSNIIGGDESHA
ncbi:arabinogalactan oligomer/maltooligosaccharide transport system permease protein [Hypnocyclicus thermotrophus]|uniref:Arabinogalactan oligomer/maltooligosaccharide transport system permease protein n=1 Tax=Hypnocyclicus thermotrophus TaxID=1627895 RepID=A0AA46I6X5_9FUSO|nr:sugar ABC transporter permease [Hypnocyclicus thermotrophus]TDT72278.1 arabinogalactan oligomer/maltooligosaccharide transport system permease protein [Hypnocyclicus thermotrophus]